MAVQTVDAPAQELPTDPTSTLETQRAYLLKMKEEHSIPSGKPSFDDCTEVEQKAIKRIEQTVIGSKGNASAIASTFNKEKPFLIRILDIKPETKTPGEEKTNPPKNDAPELPAHVKANEQLAHLASPTLDTMIDYFRYWATRSYEGYHEAVAIWVLATIAARRIVLKWRAGMWTTLYIMLVSVSGRHAKTEAAFYGSKIIRDCGLGFLLAPDEITPQRLLSKMSGKAIPRNYSVMDDAEKEKTRLKLAFSAQQGWQYDEFGDFLQEIIKGKGNNTQFYKLLKQLYDNKPEFTYDTVTRGEERIELPSLSIIGTTAPESLAPITGRDSSVWTDGAFARIAFIVPPLNSLKLQSAPDGEATVPDAIKQALIAWHNRLGIPECQIIDTAERDDLLEQAIGKDTKKREKDRPDYLIERSPLPQKAIYWSGTGIREAHELYYQALVQMGIKNNLDERLNSNYIRLPDMALKIAMLLASLENEDRMDMRHWARGQAIAERWRANLHTLMTQLPGDNSGYGALEDAVMEVLTKKIPTEQKATARDIRDKGTTIVRNAGSPKVRSVLEELYSQGAIAREGEGKTAKYGLIKGD